MNHAVRPVAVAPLLVCLLLQGVAPVATAVGQWSGNLSLEYRDFFEQPVDQRQHDGNLSVSFQPEWYMEFRDGFDAVTVEPFFRIDDHDQQRTHSDFRQLSWLHVGDAFESRVGLIKVFWGVTESLHLVDIINQTDLVENPDGEDKLGQPGINLSLIGGLGVVDLFVLPGFRERTFPGQEGRLRTMPRVAESSSAYASEDEDANVDFAIRWSHSVGDYDIGVSHFYGTGREPDLLPAADSSGEIRLSPFYDIINQTGLDLQATKGDWLWKLESIYRSPRNTDPFGAMAAGFEYTFVGIFESAVDAGLLIEYLYDERDKAEAGLFDDDVFVGTRITLNDVQSSELLAGVIVDVDTDSRFFNLEASRRIGDNMKITAEGRLFSNSPDDDPADFLSREDYIQIELGYYF